MRFFNTAGPVSPDKHYAIRPLDRVEFDELIQREEYFVLHAPRRSGKTSVLNALRDHLNSGAAGEFRCVLANVESATGDDYELGVRAVLASVAEGASALGDDYPSKTWRGIFETMGPETALVDLLTRWCEANPTPLVLLLDEIDSLEGDTLLSVLRQLRTGHHQQPSIFPQCVVLCGTRDIRDCRISSILGEVISGGNPFNVAPTALRLLDFTKAQICELLAQHTAETKQPFEEDAVAEVWKLTRGQPWLVNALCAEACFECEKARDRTRSIRAADIHAARKALAVSQRAHLDRLVNKLDEEQVQRVVEPILAGGQARHKIGDLEYVRGLGLVDCNQPPRMANPIYAEEAAAWWRGASSVASHLKL